MCIRRTEPREAAKQPVVHRTAPATESDVARASAEPVAHTQYTRFRLAKSPVATGAGSYRSGLCGSVM